MKAERKWLQSLTTVCHFPEQLYKLPKGTQLRLEVICGGAEDVGFGRDFVDRPKDMLQILQVLEVKRKQFVLMTRSYHGGGLLAALHGSGKVSLFKEIIDVVCIRHDTNKMLRSNSRFA